MKKRIVCLGDSNTWGCNAKDGSRLPEHIRWTTVMAEILGNDYTVVEEGLGGRTTVWDDCIEDISSGKSFIKTCIKSHYPFDIIIIMLGTNDLKARFSVSAEDIAVSASSLAKYVLNYEYPATNNFKIPKVLLVSPIHVGEGILDSHFGYMMSKDIHEKSKQFASHYKKYADIIGVDFLDAALYAKPSIDDHLHIEEEDHPKLAQAMAKKVKDIIG